MNNSYTNGPVTKTWVEYEEDNTCTACWQGFNNEMPLYNVMREKYFPTEEAARNWILLNSGSLTGTIDEGY